MKKSEAHINKFLLCKHSDSRLTVHNKKSRKKKRRNNEQVDFHWHTYKLLGMKEVEEFGKYTFPVSDLGEGLNSNFLKNELNNRDCFSFNYRPEQGDNLIISRGATAVRIEFVFNNGKWEEDHYSPFMFELTELDHGKLMPQVV
jgi:hypothetical protein